MTGTIKRMTPNYSLRIPYFDTPNWGIELERNMDIIDATLYAIAGLTNIRGAWENSTLYFVGDRVVANGILWVCMVTHTSISTGTFNDELALFPTYWEEANEPIDTTDGTPMSGVGSALISAKSIIDARRVLNEGNSRVTISAAGTYVLDPLSYGEHKATYVVNPTGVAKIDCAGLIPFEQYHIYTNDTGVAELDSGLYIEFHGSLRFPDATIDVKVLTIPSNHHVTLCRLGGNVIHMTMDALESTWNAGVANVIYRRWYDGTYEFIHTRPPSAIIAGAVTTASCFLPSGFDLTPAKVLSCTAQGLRNNTATMQPAGAPQIARQGTVDGLPANQFGIGNPNSVGSITSEIVTHFIGVVKL